MRIQAPCSILFVASLMLLQSGCSTSLSEPTADSKLPTIVNARALDATTIHVDFSQPAGPEASDSTNYRVVDSNSDPLTVEDVEVSDDRMAADITTISQRDDEVYSIALGTEPVVLVESFASPRVVGAISTSSTSVIVTFNRKMGPSAEDAANYIIVQENVNAEAGKLTVTAAELVLPQKIAVRLTTLTQNEVNYKLSVVNVTDVTGTSLTPPELLVNPSDATFRGTPPTCQNVCGNGAAGTDGNGACESDDDCDDDSSCDPGEEDCTGTCVCSLLDSDGDGLADHIEQRGWTVTFELTARTGLFERFGSVIREVTSDPFVADTDGDGLSDFTERELSTDPRNVDTDEDGLGDNPEFNVYFSSPVDQDTDEDQLDDLLEVTFYKTSPILADTDGDGLDDDREILELNRNARVADLPRWDLKVGDLQLLIDERYTYVDETGETVTEVSETTATLSEESEDSTVKYNSKVTTLGWEAGGSLEVSFSPSLTLEGKAFGSGDTHSGSDTTTTLALQEAYEDSLSKGREFTENREVTREVFGASISAPLTVESTGDLAFSISNLELSVLQLGRDRVSYIPIATLIPNAEITTGEPTVLNLGPFVAERGPIILGTQEVFPNLVEDLLRAPRGPVIIPSNFDVTDEFGRNFAFASQETNDRTATIVIDFGDGTSAEYNVATAGAIDDKGFVGEAGGFVGGFNTEGKVVGIPLDYALQDILGFPKETDPPVFDSVIAGPNGIVETVAAGDDIQVFTTATQGLSDISVIIRAGDNGVLDTVSLNGDDQFAVAEGYAVSPTCNEYTKQRIVEPVDGEGDLMVNSIPDGDDEYATGLALTCGEGGAACTTDDDCDDDAPCEAGETDCRNSCNAIGEPVSAGDEIIVAGPNGIIDSVAAGDDVFRGPNEICNADSDCPTRTGDATCVGGVNKGVACTSDDDCKTVASCFGGFCDEGSENVNDACKSDDDCIPIVGMCPVGGVAACDGREVLRRFRSSTTGQRNRAWLVYSDDEIPFGTNFGDIILKPQMNIFLAFEQDVDRDGLFARHEFNFGSSDRSKDTDSDMIFDAAEVRDGWVVDVAGMDPYRAFPDPRTADSDGDGVSDQQEMICGTDPRKRDTDDDGVLDFDELNDDAGGFAAECTEAAQFPPTHLDPLNPDSDGDLLLDGIEPFLCDEMDVCADPLDPNDAAQFLDTDEDGLPDNVEGVNGGWTVATEQCGNTCGFSYDGYCDETGGRCEDVSPFAGDPCANGADCAFDPTCVVQAGFCGGLILSPFANCSFNPIDLPAPQCVLFGLCLPITETEAVCGGPLAGPFPIACTSHADCAGFDVCEPLVPEAAVCTGSANDGTVCTNSADCQPVPFTCEPPACAAGTDCGDCGVQVVMEDVFSDPTRGDTDFDGLPDLLEERIGTNPNDVDTDGDGLLDFDEFSAFGEFFQFNFLYPGFFLTDAGSKQFQSDPTSQDSDGDGLTDSFELLTGWRVLSVVDNVARDVNSSLNFADSDSDGVSDQREYLGKDGIAPGMLGDTGDATDPTDPDTDDDGRLDDIEFASGTNPLLPDLQVTISLEELINVIHPTGTTDWRFQINVLRPAEDFETILVSTFDVCSEDNQFVCESLTCGTVARTSADIALAPVNETLSFTIPDGDPVVLEVLVGQVASCSDTVPALGCSFFERRTLSSTDLKGTGGYSVQEFDFNDQKGCTAILPVIVEVD